MDDFRLTEHSKELLQKNYRNDPHIKEIISRILKNPFYDKEKPKAIKTYKGKSKKDFIRKEYRVPNLNLRIFYDIIKNHKQVDILKIACTPNAHKKNILRGL